MPRALGFILAGLGAVTLSGAAAAASQDAHTLTVPLPDGSTARIDYVGNVAPRVHITPGPLSVGFPAFGVFDRSALDMERQIDAMMRQMKDMTVRPLTGGPGMNVAAYGNAPAGSSSVTVISTTNGGVTCTRTTEVTSQGVGKAPKVVSNASGDCNGAAVAPAKPVNRT
jgi:hypothetical protein